MTPDRQIRKHLAVKSAVEDQSPSPKEITTTSTATVTSSSISQPPPSNRANRLNDILGMVQNAQNEVQNALKYRPGAIRNSPSPSYTPTTPPPSNTENHSKSSERRKQLANDEMFAYSSEDDDDQETNRDHEKKFRTTMKEQVVEKEHEDENDLEKTLDNWLTKQRKKEKEMKLSSSSSVSRRGDNKVTDLRNERIHQEEEDEDDGGVADLQCMLADVLMSSGEEQLQLDEKEKSQRSRFNIL